MTNTDPSTETHANHDNLVSPNRDAEFALDGLVMTTQAQGLVEWLRRQSLKRNLWPLPFGTGCCALEYTAAHGTRFDSARLGVDLVRFEPEQSDLLVVAGTITEKQAPILNEIYQRMLAPKYVMAVGACAGSGGFYRAYNVVQGISREIPVDVYVPGCPPTPEAIIQGVRQIQERIEKGVNASQLVMRDDI